MDRPRDEREVVLSLLRTHGYNTTGFQALEPSLRYFFPTPGSCVAYVDTGAAWVAAGAPIAAHTDLDDAARAFVDEAAARGRRACFFGAESRFADASSLARDAVASQPVWDPTEWVARARRPSVREQLRRARAKGVSVSRLSAEELVSPSVRAELADATRAWLATRRMPPMGFLVDVELQQFPSERAVWIARSNGALAGVLGAVPVYLRRGWFCEDLIRLPTAPNGTAELLIDAAMRAFAAMDCRFATLGMVPLSGVGGWLRAIRAVSARLYDFGGLERFRAKLDPVRSDPIYLLRPRRVSFVRAILDVLRAFAGRSLVGFGLSTLLRWKTAAPALPG